MAAIGSSLDKAALPFSSVAPTGEPATRIPDYMVFDVTSLFDNYPPDDRPADCKCQNTCDKLCLEALGYRKWRQTLTLTKDEAVLETDTTVVQKCCCVIETARMDRTDKQERPYAQLGAVDISMTVNPCNCCAICCPVTCPWRKWAVKTRGINIMPGWGGEEKLVREIASELQQRKVNRGNIQLIRLNEHMGYELDVLSSWIDAVMDKQGAKPDLSPIEAQKVRVFTDKEYIVTPMKNRVCCCGLCSPTQCCFTTFSDSSICAPYVVILKLEQEEVVRERKTAWSFAQERRPYAQLGSVNLITDKPKVCCTCCCNDPNYDYCAMRKVGHHRIAVDAWSLTPGFEDDEEMIHEITNELQARKVSRGNIAQLEEAERSARVVEHIKANITSLMAAMSVAKPQSVHSAEMDR